MKANIIVDEIHTPALDFSAASKIYQEEKILCYKIIQIFFYMKSKDITLQRISNHIRDNKMLASIYPTTDNDDSIPLQIYHCALLPSTTLRHHTNANQRKLCKKYKYNGVQILEIYVRNTNTMA